MSKTDTARFAAGSFWDVEEAFRRLPGVISTRVGYTGGFLENPTYRQVSTDRTGHAEAVEVVFDPDAISYRALLDVFFSCHDPTTPDRQGADVGSQYRSAIFWTTREQELEAIEAKAAWQERFAFRIVTEVTPATPFYEAEEQHQRYFSKLAASS